MDVNPIIDFLSERIGLNAKSIGIPMVEKAVRKCMVGSDTASIDDYLTRLLSVPSELKKLIESVVIRETYFFRDWEPYSVLKRCVGKFRLDKADHEPIRILSVPCSTGEEPYSIAMLLLNMKLNKEQFRIDAVDISDHALKVARRGIYSPYSFRRADLAFRNRYFSRSGEQFVLNKEVRESVNFQQGNLVEDAFVDGRNNYDLIFCRNIMIYFDNKARGKVINVLSQMLNKAGILFVGHAEASIFAANGFLLLDYPKAFAFCKASEADSFDGLTTKGKSRVSCQNKMDRMKVKSHPTSLVKSISTKKAASPKDGKKTYTPRRDTKEEETDIKKEISEATRLAGIGAIDKAVKKLKELADRKSISEEVYYHIGKAIDAMGDSYQAEEFLKRAIYLNPNYHEALSYLVLICERMGNLRAAEQFRRRADRVAQRAGKIRSHEKSQYDLGDNKWIKKKRN